MSTPDIFDLTGRTALVTGARRGIGRAIALAFAAQGARIAIHHTGTDEEQRDAAETVAKTSGKAVAFSADFAISGSAARLTDDVLSEFGAVDILVLNASIQLLQDVRDIDDASFDRQIAINLRAPLELIQRLVPAMEQRGWGRVVAIGSIQQVRSHPQMLVYAGTKSAQLNWVRSLARQFGPNGVTLNNLAPGELKRRAMQISFPIRQREPRLRRAFPSDGSGGPTTSWALRCYSARMPADILMERICSSMAACNSHDRREGSLAKTVYVVCWRGLRRLH